MVTSTLLPPLTTVTLLFTVVAGSGVPVPVRFSAANASARVIVVATEVVGSAIVAVVVFATSNPPLIAAFSARERFCNAAL